MLHKLRAAMVRPGRDRIGTASRGGRNVRWWCNTWGATRAAPQELVVGMVEVLPRKQALGPDPNLPSGQRPQYDMAVVYRGQVTPPGYPEPQAGNGTASSG